MVLHKAIFLMLLMIVNLVYTEWFTFFNVGITSSCIGHRNRSETHQFAEYLWKSYTNETQSLWNDMKVIGDASNWDASWPYSVPYIMQYKHFDVCNNVTSLTETTELLLLEKQYSYNTTDYNYSNSSIGMIISFIPSL